MITGALLLSRNYRGDGTKIFLRHNWLQLFITTEIWLVIMFWYKQLLPGSILFAYGVRACLIRFIATIFFINSVTLGNMWYMFMILCLYLVIPLLAIAIEEIDPRCFLLPVIIVINCSFILPDINLGLRILGYDHVLATQLQSGFIFSMYAVFLLCGYYINRGVLTRIKTYVLLIVLGCAFVAYCGVQLWTYSLDFDYVIGYESVFPLIISVCLFELLRRIRVGDKNRIRKAATELSRISFGIYFIHICIMEGLWYLIDYKHWQIVYLTKFVFLEGVSFFGAVAIIQVFRRNKWISKHILGIKPA